MVFTFGDRRYRVRGLPKNLSPETLKINLLVSCKDAYFVDTLDLYSAPAAVASTCCTLQGAGRAR
ncbi:DNA primase [Janthinobacterium sp. CG23_2]|nr:DNA primase [Janthinobacterium sp. CG23_2]CUU29379.1 DNA primase [Janthinobacterium sp. CG23_2]